MELPGELMIATEFKDYQVDGPLVDQIVGTARRSSGKKRLNAEIYGILIVCRGYTNEALKRANEHERNEGFRVQFKVVKD
jgi:hypothetical protein